MLVRHGLGLSKTEKRFPTKGTCLAIYSRTVNENTALDSALERDFPWCAMWEKELKELFRRYVQMKQDQNVLDYDDLLLYWHELLADDDIAERVGGRFDHILVDEYQDTNIIQAGILQRMRRTIGT